MPANLEGRKLYGLIQLFTVIKIHLICLAGIHVLAAHVIFLDEMDTIASGSGKSKSLPALDALDVLGKYPIRSPHMREFSYFYKMASQAGTWVCHQKFCFTFF